ncbi:MAG: hypothetical protein IJT77_04650, partial [Clostridia bacterium]|nr:hypothetical protein [Clostridia bacterium]
MLFFQEHSLLKNEFDRLFSSMFSNPEMMKSIVTVLATRHNGFSRGQLLQKIGLQDSGEFSSHLRTLISGMLSLNIVRVFSESPEPFIYGPHLGSPIFYFLNFDAILCIRSPFLFIRLTGYSFP